MAMTDKPALGDYMKRRAEGLARARAKVKAIKPACGCSGKCDKCKKKS